MKPDILQTGAMPAIEAALHDAYTVHRLWDAPDRDAFLADIGPRVRAIVTGGAFGASTALIDAAPQLGLIAVHGVGTDAVDLERAKARGIRVSVTAGVLTEDVADMALGLLLAVARRLAEGDRFVRAGKWPKDRFPLGRKVAGKRLGILGFGRIGQAIARRAEGFGMVVSYTDLHALDAMPQRFVPSLEELARDSDFLVIAASASAQTRGLVGRAVLDAVGPEGILINIARGSIVDEAELVAALQEGRLGAAGLDVFADEPNVPEALFALDNVVLEPHQASATVETRIEMGRNVLANLEAFFAGRSLPTALP
jgi:lactate dehydrogenase-like 2-hydroxyacid dehydrogenase